MSDASPPNPPPPRRGPPPPPKRDKPAPPAEAAEGAPARKSEAPAPMTQGDKDAITLRALGLLNEQVQARIVHYKGDMETSPELDAITAQVVQQLKEMQAALGGPAIAGGAESASDMESKQTATLKMLLGRVCANGDHGNLITQNLKPIGKRVAKLFFESELHEKTKGDKEKTIFHAEQGVYYVLQRYKNRIRTELQGFEYANPEAKEMTLELLEKMERDLQVAFLSRRSPELNRVMTIFTSVLVDFFQNHLAARLEQMARITIKNARTAHQPNSVSYKIMPDRFQAFREEWERVLMQQMVNFCGDELLDKLGHSNEEVREETLKFFTDPHVYSETCNVICDALYDFLCLEGFLDLPVDWRVAISRDAN